LVVSELSRLGRSLGQVIQIVDKLVKRKVRFTAIKEAIRFFEGRQDMQTKVMIALFGLFAEVERDLISERTKEGLARDLMR
jgi:DNA invertase Pin-like site-specific DNA recombinase